MRRCSSLPVVISRAVLWLLFAIILTWGILRVALAAPMPPRLVVNHETKQCATILPGDECGDAILPEGWEYSDGECPQGYAEVELRLEWAHFKTSFCCTEGHSGSSGDCEDLVIRSFKRECAFVEDIHNCSRLPFGWKSAEGLCPAEFTWIGDVACTSQDNNLPGSAASTSAAGTPPPGSDAPTPGSGVTNGGEPGAGPPNKPPSGLCGSLMLFLVAGIPFTILRLRRA